MTAGARVIDAGLNLSWPLLFASLLAHSRSRSVRL